jgi:glycosyltransferase involved in cell wall biosynthesis
VPKHLLVVAFHYPPDNSSTGVLRTLKFTRYLLGHGWHSTVLTVPEDLYRNRDEHLLHQVPPQVKVVRAPCRDVRDQWGIRGIYPGFLAVPDRYGSWRRPAVRAGLEIVARAEMDALYTTYPIPSAHLIGLRLKRKTGLPWIADFRDPWAGGGGHGLRYRVESWLEGTVVREADLILANTEVAREDFLARYPRLAPEKFVTLPNGYDEEDFPPELCQQPATQPFTIVYPGSIDPLNRSPLPLIEAIGQLLRGGQMSRHDVRLHFLGAGAALRQPWFTDAVRAAGLGNIVSGVEGRIPYAESLKVLAGAGLLVVLNEPLGAARETELGYSRLMVPAKVYEYLRLGRPFLALCGEGAVPRLLGQLDAGWWCPPADIDGIARRILAAKVLHERDEGLAIAPDKIAAFERRALTAKLASLLDGLTGGGE